MNYQKYNGCMFVLLFNGFEKRVLMIIGSHKMKIYYFTSI